MFLPVSPLPLSRSYLFPPCLCHVCPMYIKNPEGAVAVAEDLLQVSASLIPKRVVSEQEHLQARVDSEGLSQVHDGCVPQEVTGQQQFANVLVHSQHITNLLTPLVGWRSITVQLINNYTAHFGQGAPSP